MNPLNDTDIKKLKECIISAQNEIYDLDIFWWKKKNESLYSWVNTHKQCLPLFLRETNITKGHFCYDDIISEAKKYANKGDFTHGAEKHFGWVSRTGCYGLLCIDVGWVPTLKSKERHSITKISTPYSNLARNKPLSSHSKDTATSENDIDMNAWVDSGTPADIERTYISIELKGITNLSSDPILINDDSLESVYELLQYKPSEKPNIEIRIKIDSGYVFYSSWVLVTKSQLNIIYRHIATEASTLR
tara:strand:- start:2561 stop:3301 length:741 start_codon:yes stop_codon:yes gene_type:complete